MAGIYEFVISGNNTTEFVQNVLHYDVSEGGGHSAYEYALDLIANWASTLETVWLDCLPNDTYITSYRAKKVSTPGGPTAVQVFSPGAKQGTRGASAASGIGPVLLFPATVGGVNVTGRIFIPGVAHADIEENVFFNGLPAKLNTLITDLLQTITMSTTGSTAQYSVYHRPSLTRPTPAFTHALVGRVSEKVGTQRKRYVPVP